MKLAEKILEINEKAQFGTWKEGKKELSFGGNTLVKVLTDSKTGAELKFQKDGLLASEKSVKSQVMLTTPEDGDNKKINKELDWYSGKDKQWFTSGEIKTALAKANKELSSRG